MIVLLGAVRRKNVLTLVNLVAVCLLVESLNISLPNNTFTKKGCSCEGLE